ncbi:sugar phosphate isomerase/epimerase [Alteromonas pelagimontana]|uniref:Sugar phosphate isomerase/epimerase n=2 Tax=Alteromonas pelagimontana TaxID=1858656 RepID=A0A6M4ML64_9ALTE|nr:sugar phosphate isomerase/epimerase [Alteromonas pelagimontana]
MNRRHFLQASLVGAAALLPFSGFSLTQQKEFKMGLQLYTVRDDMASDPIATLKAVKAMGYEDFEVYGFNEEKGTFYGYKPSEFKAILDDLGLTVSSGHYGFAPYLDKPVDELKRFVDKCIAGAQAINSAYITWPVIAPEQRTLDNLKRMTGLLNAIGEQVNAAGLGFAYHNQSFAFEKYNGKSGYDIIINETDPELVKLQMDMYWVMRAAEKTPKQLVDEQPGRYVMWHLKDMDKISQDYTEMGNGSIDYADILPSPVKSGLEYYYLEQGGNFAQSPLQSVATSAEYFKRHLQKYL